MRNLTKITSMLVILFVTLLAASSCSKKDNEPVDPTPTPTPSTKTWAVSIGGISASPNAKKSVVTNYKDELKSLFEAQNYTIEDSDEARLSTIKKFIEDKANSFLEEKYTKAGMDSCKVYSIRYYITITHTSGNQTRRDYFVNAPTDSYGIEGTFTMNNALSKKLREVCQVDVKNRLYAKGFKLSDTVSETDVKNVVKDVLTSAVASGRLTKEEITQAQTDKIKYKATFYNFNTGENKTFNITPSIVD